MKYTFSLKKIKSAKNLITKSNNVLIIQDPFENKP